MRIGTSISTKKLDQACVEEYKIPLIVMMENAVLSAVKHLDTDLYDKYVIVSGVGNNGGDGLGIARQLKAKNKEVKVFLIGNMEKITQCSKTNLQILQAMKVEYEVICNNEDDNIKLENLKNNIKNSDVVIDCIFGTGLEREIKGIFKEVIKIINENIPDNWIKSNKEKLISEYLNVIIKNNNVVKMGNNLIIIEWDTINSIKNILKKRRMQSKKEFYYNTCTH